MFYSNLNFICGLQSTVRIAIHCRDYNPLSGLQSIVGITIHCQDYNSLLGCSHGATYKLSEHMMADTHPRFHLITASHVTWDNGGIVIW